MCERGCQADAGCRSAYSSVGFRSIIICSVPPSPSSIAADDRRRIVQLIRGPSSVIGGDSLDLVGVALKLLTGACPDCSSAVIEGTTRTRRVVSMWALDTPTLVVGGSPRRDPDGRAPDVVRSRLIGPSRLTTPFGGTARLKTVPVLSSRRGENDYQPTVNPIAYWLTPARPLASEQRLVRAMNSVPSKENGLCDVR